MSKEHEVATREEGPNGAEQVGATFNSSKGLTGEEAKDRTVQDEERGDPSSRRHNADYRPPTLNARPRPQLPPRPRATRPANRPSSPRPPCQARPATSQPPRPARCRRPARGSAGS